MCGKGRGAGAQPCRPPATARSPPDGPRVPERPFSASRSFRALRFSQNTSGMMSQFAVPAPVGADHAVGRAVRQQGGVRGLHARNGVAQVDFRRVVDRCHGDALAGLERGDGLTLTGTPYT